MKGMIEREKDDEYRIISISTHSKVTTLCREREDDGGMVTNEVIWVKKVKQVGCTLVHKKKIKCIENLRERVDVY